MQKNWPNEQNMPIFEKIYSKNRQKMHFPIKYAKYAK